MAQKKEKVAIDADKISGKIITAVALSKRLKKKYVVAFCNDKSGQGIYKAYNRLLKLGYIVEKDETVSGKMAANHHRARYVYVTRKGRDAFCEMYGKQAIESIPDNVSDAMKLERQQRFNTINAIMASNGIIWSPTVKPTFKAFLNCELGVDQMKYMLDRGIAYSSREIKAYITERHNEEWNNHSHDSLSGARACHVLFYKNMIYVIYDSGSKKMKWSNTVEGRFKSVLVSAINESKISELGLVKKLDERILDAIIFCSSPKWVSSVLETQKNTEWQKRKSDRLDTVNLSVKTIEKAYRTSGLVIGASIESMSTQFENAIKYRTSEGREEYGDQYTAMYPYLHMYETDPMIRLKNIGASSDGEETNYIIFPYIDLSWIQIARIINMKGIYVVPDGTQNVIYDCLGKLAVEVRRLGDMKTLNYISCFGEPYL